MNVTLKRKVLTFVIFFVIFALVGLVFWRVVPEPGGANGSHRGPPAISGTASTTSDPIKLLAAPSVVPATHNGPHLMARIHNRQDFIAKYKLGWFRTTRQHFPYSNEFKLWFKASARVAYKKRYPNRVYNSTRSWRNWTDRDTCIARVNAYRGPLDCTHNFRADPALQSAYFRKRSATQNKWTTRIVYCGATMIFIYGTGGTTVGALGGGTGLCFAGLMVD